ncbi:glycoside hydrolase [Ascobolus immersus RN42]|uniref:lytic cellulose monooxygenase (C4-dehydrogenating) n=1 Tax=Ascobolus immersus RN42 TaxID=1160509 RepID=A0A3N4IDQ9_ASCIM|nr:glycoside hydrolase [Ascobolus immersus RN42]
MKVAATALVVLASASQAFAHYRFNQLIANGQTYPDGKYIRKWTPYYWNGPIEDVSLPDIRCNANPQTADGTVDVAAGSTVGFRVDQDVIHPGPYTAYLAKAPTDINNWDGNGDWFKIWEQGPTAISSSGISWDMANREWTFKIPASTPSGQYLLRFEHIGLHGASNTNGAQFYMSCAQINVTGGGNGRPGPTIKFPGGYKATDPGVKINIYWPVPTQYIIPGPAVWRG